MWTEQYHRLSLLHSTRAASIHRAQDELSGVSVILKTTIPEAGPDVLPLFRHDYTLSQEAPADWRLHPLDWSEQGDQIRSLFADPGGESLEKWAAQPQRSLTQRLEVALALVDAVAGIHAEGLIHRDLCPCVLLWNEQLRRLVVLDFALATRLNQEAVCLFNFGTLAGNPAYCAPEQTGRMNCSADVRADYYSLGATLYYLFTGAPPFTHESALELVHAHLAVTPQPPVEHNPQLPSVLSELILKLLQKAPEDRYQGLEGLRRDLARIQEEWLNTGDVPEFALGDSDHTPQFRIPAGVYGRESAQQTLMKGVDAAAGGQGQIILVEGPAGIGKTGLINGLYLPLTTRRAYFVSGKFDQLRRDRPYTALIEALQQLIRDVLSEPQHQLQLWRERLDEAMGRHAALLTPLIPELTYILGEPEALAQFEPEENRRIFTRLMTRLVQCFCSDERPLVLYLDDLQWADRASLELLGDMTREMADHCFLLIGAFRSEQVDAVDGFTDFLDALGKGPMALSQITLEALDEAAIAELLSDCFRRPREAVWELARGIRSKTGGVPFFIHQFLDMLYRRGFIEAREDGWWLDPEQLEQLPATDNQVAWMAEQLQQLDEACLRLLQCAACLGNTFGFEALARVEGRSIPEVLADLQPALDAGLVSIQRNRAADRASAGDDPDQALQGHFSHDRIQQAAYSLFSEAQRSALHARMGRILLAETPEAKQEQQLFNLVYHLNQGGFSDADDSELRRRIAMLNYQAGERARLSAAHSASLAFFTAGIAHLEADAWRNDYDWTLALYTGAMEAAFLSHDYAAMEGYGRTILEQIRDPLHARQAYCVWIQACNVRNQLEQAIRVAREFLAALGVRFPANPNTGHIVLSLSRTRWLLRNHSVESLRALPELKEPRRLAIMEVLHRVASSAYFASPPLHALLVLKMVRLAACHGHAPAYTVPYAPYGIVLCGVLHHYERGFEFGQLSLELAEHPRAVPLKCRTRVLVYTFIWQWSRYAGENIAPLREAYHQGLEAGDHEYAAYAAVIELITSLFVGQWLDAMDELVARYREPMFRLSEGTAMKFYRVMASVVHQLRGEQDEPWRLDTEGATEEQLAQDCGEDRTGLACLRTAQMVMRYRFGRLEEAEQLLVEVDALADAVRASLVSADHHWFGALTRLARARNGRSSRQRNRMIERHRRMLKGWAQSAPMNFRHKQRLVEAEWHRNRGDAQRAMSEYEQAIADARDHGYIQDRALAQELAAEFCESLGLATQARFFAGEACTHYEQWGATALVQCLRKRGLAGLHSNQARVADWQTPQMDLAAFRSALKAISQSRIHSSMMDAVIRGAVTFAGAQSGHLLLNRSDGNFCVEAQWRVDEPEPIIFQATPLARAEQISQAVVHYVSRTQTHLVIDDAQMPLQVLPSLHRDRDVLQRGVRSVLCMPLTSGSDEEQGVGVMGVLYLENNATAGAFTAERLETLEIICLAAAGRLELSRRAVTDGLTRLYNHEYFQNILETEFHLARRRNRDLSLLMLDVDHFKAFNDQWGHQCGDAVLQNVAAILLDMSRGSDIVARYGGEEFAVILPETSLAQGLEVAERVRQSIGEARFDHDGKTHEVTVSVGVAALTDDISECRALITEADQRLYKAKARGRNRVVAEAQA